MAKAILTCTISGYKYQIDHAPSINWPHPAIYSGIHCPDHIPHTLQLGAYLFALSQLKLVEPREPLTPSNFSPIWTIAALGALASLHSHIASMGTDRASDYPILTLYAATTSDNVEQWLDECHQITKGYQPLECATANATHNERVLLEQLKAKAHNNALMRAAFSAYLDRALIDCALEGEAAITFIKVCQAPLGHSSAQIKQAIDQLNDWALQDEQEDKLIFDSIMLRLMDALLDKRENEAARLKFYNNELARGLFNTQAQPLALSNNMLAKKTTQSKAMTNLAALLNKIESSKSQ